MKSCDRCKWRYASGQYAICCAPGQRTPPSYCSIHRSAGWLWARLGALCGREGRWFEPEEKA